MTAEDSRATTKPVKKFTGKKALLWAFGFFGIIFTVNGIMATIALGTWGGLDTPDAYRKGLYYNEELAAASVQKSSGWKISLSHIPTAIQGDRLDVKIIWPENDLPPAKVTAMITRPVTNAHDQKVFLTQTGTGVYTTPVKLPQAGQWNITVHVKRVNGDLYQLQEKIFVAPQK